MSCRDNKDQTNIPDRFLDAHQARYHTIHMDNGPDDIRRLRTEKALGARKE